MRFLQILKVINEYFVSNKHKDKILGKRIREACEELGTVFVKFGQMMSTRYDMLSKEDCEELQKLLNNGSKKIPYDKIEEIFIHDFGEKPTDLFLEFNKEPIASASISQVYKAKLKNGKLVAVKVRRPYIGKQIEKDLTLFIKIFKVASLFSKRLRVLKVKSRLLEMKKWMLKEIDFESERNNIQRIKKTYNFCDGKGFKHYKGKGVFPDAYQEHSSKNIITMDYIDGITLLEKEKIMDNPEYSIYDSLKAYLGVSIYQIFNSKILFIQADPHPANFLILKNGGASSIDCGMFVEIKGEQLEGIKNIFIHIYLNEPEKLTKLILKMSRTKKNYYNKIFPDMKKYIEKAQSESIGFWFMELLRISLKHKIKLPTEFTAFGRSAIVMDGTVKYFDKNLDALQIIGEEIRDEVQKRTIENLKNIDYMPLLYNATEKLRESPNKFNKLIDKYYDNPEKIIYEIKSIVNYLKK